MRIVVTVIAGHHVAVPIEPRPGPDLSRQLEDRELDSRGFTDTAATGLLQFDYRCAWPGCIAGTLFPDRLRVLPVLRDGVVRCPLCDNEVERLDTLANACEVKLCALDTELTRLAVDEGDPMYLGRSGGRDVIPLDQICDHPAAGEISRRHVALVLADDDRLLVSDLGSRNGSQLRNETRIVDEPVVLEPGTWYEMTHEHVLTLGTTLRLRRSGRRFVRGTRSPSDAFSSESEATIPASDLPGSSGSPSTAADAPES